MAGKNKYVASIVLDGEKDFKSAVTACNQKLATMRSELNLNKEEFAGNANSINALRSRYGLLERSMQLQNQKIGAIRTGLNHASQEYQRVGTNLDRLQGEYQKATKALEEMEKSSDVTDEELKKQKEEVKNLADAITRGEASYGKAGKSVEDWHKKLYTAQAQEKKTSRELANYKKYMDEAKRSVDGCAVSIDSYGKKSKETEVAVKEGVNALAGAVAASGISSKAEELAEELYDCAKAADEFSVATAKLSTIADTSQVPMEKLNSDLMEISGETAQAVTELSESAYQAISAGTDTARAAEVVGTATKSSIAGFTDTSTAIDGLSTVVNSYGDEVKNATEVSDIFLTVQNLGKTSFGELSSNIGKVATNASNYNVSIHNLGTAYIELTKRGIQTSEATTYTNSMLKELGKSSSNLSKILKKKTGKSFAELMEDGNSLGDVLGIIYDSVGRNNTAFINLFSSQEAATGAVTMLKRGTEGFNNTLQQVQKSAGATDAAYEKMTNTSEFAKAKVINGINNIKIAIGTRLNEALGGLIGKAGKITEWVSEVLRKNPELISVITAFSASLVTLTGIVAGYTAITTFAIPLIQSFTAAMASNPIGLVAVAVSTLVAGLVTFCAMQKSANQETDKEIVAMRTARKEIEEKDKSIREGMEATKEKIKTTEDDITKTDTLVARLLTLNKVEKKSAGQKAEIKGITESLKDKIPKLAKAYDEETGSVKLTRKEILKLADAYKQQAIAEGLQKQIKEATDAAAEAALNHEKAEQASAEATKKRQKAANEAYTAEKRWENAKKNQKAGYNNTEEMAALAGEYEEKKKKLKEVAEEEKKCQEEEKKTKKTVDDTNKSVDQAVAFCDKYEKKLSQKEKAEKKNTSAAKKTVSEYDKLSAAYGKAEKGMSNWGTKTSQTTKKTFQSVLSTAKKTGAQIPKGLSQALKNGSKSTETATKELNSAVGKKLLDLVKEARKAGIYIPQEISDGLKNGSLDTGKAYDSINKQIKKATDKQEKEMDKVYLKMPKKMESAFKKGGSGAIQALNQSRTAIKELQEKAGVSSTDGLVKGVKDGTPKVEEAYRELARKANNAFKNTLDIHSPSRVFRKDGEYTVLGVISGLDAQREQMHKKFAELGNLADSSFRDALEIHSPSKKFQKSGEYAVGGSIKGMQLKLGDAKKTAKKTAEEVHKEAEKKRKELQKKRDEAERKREKKAAKIYQKTENKISTKHYNEKQTVEMWKKTKDAIDKTTDAYVKAQKKLKAARDKLAKETSKIKKEQKKNYKSMMADLKAKTAEYKSQIEDLRKAYSESVASSQASIGGSWGMFSKASVTKTNNAEGLIRNMKTQADTVAEYQKNMDKLRKSGLSASIIKELEDAGISAAGDVSTLASMNKQQLQEYQKYYNARESSAKKEAIAQNEALKKSTDAQIATLQKKMTDAQKAYKKKVGKWEKKYKKQMKSLGVSAGDGFAEGIEKGQNKIYKAIAKMTGQTVKQVKKNLGIHSPSRVFDEMGGYTGLGFAQGLDRETRRLSEILLGNMPDTVSPPKPSAEGTAVTGQGASEAPVQLNLYMDSNMVASSVYRQVDLMQGADIRLIRRGLAR